MVRRFTTLKLLDKILQTDEQKVINRQYRRVKHNQVTQDKTSLTGLTRYIHFHTKWAVEISHCKSSRENGHKPWPQWFLGSFRWTSVVMIGRWYSKIPDIVERTAFTHSPHSFWNEAITEFSFYKRLANCCANYQRHWHNIRTWIFLNPYAAANFRTSWPSTLHE